MSTTEDRAPGIAERYSSAIETSNMKVCTERRGAADMILAAGWSDGFGASLMRLRAEFDGVRAEHATAQAQERQADTAARKAGGQKATEIRADAAGAALTARALILIRLKTLASVKAELGRMAVQAATLERFMEPDGVVLILVGQCLDVWLDPNCHHCGGRGFNGGGRHEDSGPQVICRACSGTGKRHQNVGKTDEQRRFAALTLAAMDQLVTNAEIAMSRSLRDIS